MSKLLHETTVTIVPLVGIAILAPFIYDNHLLLFNFIVFMVLAQGINITYGFTGYLPFGYVGFFGVGAYGFAISIMQFHSGPLLAILVGGAASTAIGVIMIPLLRLTGPYFAIANLAAALAIAEIVANPSLQAITNGPYGITLSGIYAPIATYSVAVVVLVFACGCVLYLRHSRFGLSLRAIRDDQISASMAGINVVRARALAWMLSAFIAGLIGGTFAWYASVFFPENVFSLDFTIFAIVFALFGGVTTVTGPILGVVLLYGLYNYIGVSSPEYFQFIYGFLIMLIVLFLPNGLVTVLRRWRINVI